MNLLELYSNLLQTAGMTHTQDGTVNTILTGESEPALIKGKRLVLPTKQQLTSADWQHRVVFHPLAENILKGDTEVTSYYRKALASRLNLVFTFHMLNLLRIAASPSEHKHLRAKQTAYLVEMRDVDEKTYDNFVKLLNRINTTDEGDYDFVYFTVRRNGKVKDVTYPRVGVVLFPFYDALQKAENNTVAGVKLRVKDLNAFKKLCEYIMPGLENPEGYYVGSDSKIAPHFSALMRSAIQVVSNLNEITSTFFKEEDEEFQKQLITGDWVELMEDLTPIVNDIRLIPNQDTPAQETATGSQLEMPEAPQPQPVVMQPQPAQPVYQQPVAQPVVQPAPHPAPASNSVDAILARAYGAQPVAYHQPQPVYQQPVYQQPVAYNGWNPMYTQPTYGMPAQPSPYPVGEYGYPVKG